MKTYFVCSPYRSCDPTVTDENIKYARYCCNQIACCGHNPIAPHLLCTQFFDDSNDAQRKAGLRLSNDWLKKSDVVAVFTARGVSQGMSAEIKLAHKLGKKIQYFQ
jgi:hypothetical protein